MRILIPGGSGLIGRRLSVALTAAGHEVIVLSRRPERVVGLPEGARAAGWDGRTADGWGELLDGDSTIVNLAGENIAAGRWTEERKRRIRASRERAGRAVTEAVQRAKTPPKALLQASAVGFYGTGSEEVDEASAAGGDFLAEVCFAWEAATEAVEESGTRRALLRTGVVLDPEGGALPKMVLPFRFFGGGPVGDGSQWLPWIHIADEISAIIFLLERDDLSGPFNLTAPHPLTNGEISKLLGKVLRRPSLLSAPAFALRLALGEMSGLLLKGQRAVPRRLLEAGFEFRFPHAEDALRDLLA